MIFGIGTDVLELARVERVYQKYGDHFVERLLLPAERAQLARTRRPVRFLAMRFAAKEAIVKAMGTGFSHGMWIRDCGIVQNSWGKPEVVYWTAINFANPWYWGRKAAYHGGKEVTARLLMARIADLVGEEAVRLYGRRQPPPVKRKIRTPAVPDPATASSGSHP